jgi:hypothetical protein
MKRMTPQVANDRHSSLDSFCALKSDIDIHGISRGQIRLGTRRKMARGTIAGDVNSHGELERETATGFVESYQG